MTNRTPRSDDFPVEENAASPSAGRRSAPRKATPKYLENAALYYLERFATSAENLRRVLMRKVDKSVRAHGTDRDEGAAAIAGIVERFIRSGLLDDAAYARARVASLRRRGDGARTIHAKLRAKGVAKAEIDAALAGHAEDEGGEGAEMAAAARLARRRKLGPYRDPAARADRRERDLAALARAGFSYDVARTVIDGGGEDFPAGD